tara:strand:+ start:531 stop:1061 length:531 start_codon:yes stop_codon:yes gene_type:complete
MSSIGYIYKIICSSYNNFCYIGSTYKGLNQRWKQHKEDYSKWIKNKHNKHSNISIYPYFFKYGIHNFKIILIKSYEIVRTHQTDFKHLHAYELLWINNTKNCVNKYLPFNPLKKNKLYKKYYYQKNKEKYKDYNDKIIEKNKEKYTCICGSTLTIGFFKSGHKKTKKHIDYIQNLN